MKQRLRHARRTAAVSPTSLQSVRAAAGQQTWNRLTITGTSVSQRQYQWQWALRLHFHGSDYPSWKRRQPQAARPNMPVIYIGPADTGRQTCKLGAAVHHKALGPRGRARPNTCRLSRTLTSSPAARWLTRPAQVTAGSTAAKFSEQNTPPPRHCGRLGGGTVHSHPTGHQPALTSFQKPRCICRAGWAQIRPVKRQSSGRCTRKPRVFWHPPSDRAKKTKEKKHTT